MYIGTILWEYSKILTYLKYIARLLVWLVGTAFSIRTDRPRMGLIYMKPSMWETEVLRTFMGWLCIIKPQSGKRLGWKEQWTLIGSHRSHCLCFSFLFFSSQYCCKHLCSSSHVVQLLDKFVPEVLTRYNIPSLVSVLQWWRWNRRKRFACTISEKVGI